MIESPNFKLRHYQAVAESAVSDEYRAVLLACAKQCREDYEETE